MPLSHGSEDAALGAVLGALVGDAAGAVLEFLGRPITSADVAHALTMPGGGTWELAPGQVTDDGELTMSLLRALVEFDRRPRHYATPSVSVARWYAQWASSEPFDMGVTTRRSIGCLRDAEWVDRAHEAGIAVAMKEAASARCTESKANGSLMRATPLGVWGAYRDRETLVCAATEDARLSHPNDACVHAVVAYTLAIATLVRSPGSATEAFDDAYAYLASKPESEVFAWLKDAKNDVRVPFTPQDGFVRIAFTHAFRHLARGTSYEEAIAETLLGGGDTDTNACIVGGLLGARWGISVIPESMRHAVLGCRTERGKNPRPADYHPQDTLALVRALLRTELAPSSLAVQTRS